MTVHNKQVRLSSIDDCARAGNHQLLAAAIFTAVAIIAALRYCLCRVPDKSESRSSCSGGANVSVVVFAVIGSIMWGSSAYHASACFDQIYIVK